jgi:hypothetical protein
MQVTLPTNEGYSPLTGNKGGFGWQCGTKVITERIDVCEAAKRALGSGDFANHASRNCQCFPQAIDLPKNGLYKPYYEGALIGSLGDYFFRSIYSLERV